MAEAWKDGLSEEYRSSTLVKEASSLNDVIKMTLEAQQMLGNSVRIPSEHASEAEQSAFKGKMTELGLVPRATVGEYVRPEKAEQYAITDPGPDVEALGITQTDVDQWKAYAFEAGMSPEQFDSFAMREIAARKAVHEAREGRYAETDATLKSEWGENAFDSKKTQALAAAERFGGPELVNHLGEFPDPAVLRALAEVGKLFEETGMGDLSRPTFAPETKAEAQLKLNEILGNKDHPFNKGPMGPGGREVYDAASNEVMRLKRITLNMKADQEDDMFEDA